MPLLEDTFFDDEKLVLGKHRTDCLVSHEISFRALLLYLFSFPSNGGLKKWERAILLPLMESMKHAGACNHVWQELSKLLIKK